MRIHSTCVTSAQVALASTAIVEATCTFLCHFTENFANVKICLNGQSLKLSVTFKATVVAVQNVPEKNRFWENIHFSKSKKNELKFSFL